MEAISPNRLLTPNQGRVIRLWRKLTDIREQIQDIERQLRRRDQNHPRALMMNWHKQLIERRDDLEYKLQVVIFHC